MEKEEGNGMRGVDEASQWLVLAISHIAGRPRSLTFVNGNGAATRVGGMDPKRDRGRMDISECWGVQASQARARHARASRARCFSAALAKDDVHSGGDAGVRERAPGAIPRAQ